MIWSVRKYESMYICKIKHFIRLQRPSLTTKIVLLEFPYKKTSWFFPSSRSPSKGKRWTFSTFCFSSCHFINLRKRYKPDDKQYSISSESVELLFFFSIIFCGSLLFMRQCLIFYSSFLWYYRVHIVLLFENINLHVQYRSYNFH